MPDIVLYNADCLEIMPTLNEKSVDMILCDLPYGTTKNKWDTPIDLYKLWEQYKRIIKDKGAVVLFSQMPFGATLISSNIEMFKYEWIWEKPMATGFLNCKFAPMKCHENILVFSKSAACFVRDINSAMTYNPQFGEGNPYKITNTTRSKNYDYKYMRDVVTKSDGTRYPRDIQKFPHDKDKLHPTQKPIALLEYLIKTYTNEGDLVLDNCMGSGSTGVACKNLNRDFIGIELNEKYFNIARERIMSEQNCPVRQTSFSHDSISDDAMLKSNLAWDLLDAN